MMRRRQKKFFAPRMHLLFMYLARFSPIQEMCEVFGQICQTSLATGLMSSPRIMMTQDVMTSPTAVTSNDQLPLA